MDVETTDAMGYRSLELSVDTRGRALVVWTTALILAGGVLCTRAAQDQLSRLVDAQWSCLGLPCTAAPPRAGAPHGFLGDVRLRLPRYREHFRAAAERSGVDWRLLAAIGYQESRWDPQAVSPTGVRGLMMLTNQTAALLKVADREDAEQSIHGGSRFLALILRRLPPQIRGADRTAMALAAYNQGLGHLLDARTLTAARGGDPNRWADVRDALPLLADPQWYVQTRYGYARGQEAVGYVAGVHRYYEALRLATGDAPAAAPVRVKPMRLAAKPAPAAVPAAVRRVAARNRIGACLDLSRIGIGSEPRGSGAPRTPANTGSLICSVQVAAAN